MSPKVARLAVLVVLALVATAGPGAPGSARPAVAAKAKPCTAKEPQCKALARHRARRRAMRPGAAPTPAAPAVPPPAVQGSIAAPLGPPIPPTDPGGPLTAPPASPPPAGVRPGVPLRVAAGSGGLVDVANQAWRADVGFDGGSAAASGSPVARTSTPALYQHARLGAGGYQLPVAYPGTYAVTLFFAEAYGAAPGARVFDVTAEGETVAEAVDVAAAAGPNAAYHVVFPAAVVDGALDLGFVAVAGQPLVSAIQVQWWKAAAPDATVPAWSDEFDGPEGDAPNPADWTADVGGRGWGNDELQYYTDRRSNAATDGAGNLAITAVQEPFTGADGIAREYTSARLQSWRKREFTYGRLAARIQIPAGQGIWPAFWTLGDGTYGTLGWPAAGEIDVMEILGQAPRVLYGTVHGPRGAGAYAVGRSLTAAAPLSDGFHEYSLLWLPGAIQVSLDGRPYYSVTPSDLPYGAKWVFDGPQFLLLNVAVGGRWPGAPDATTPFPARMLVDWVRLWD
jgi:beta-glucanase (GH16 family)